MIQLKSVEMSMNNFKVIHMEKRAKVASNKAKKWILFGLLRMNEIFYFIV